jgi:pimeloyl-ACP methyl ester carboxylesterase
MKSGALSPTLTVSKNDSPLLQISPAGYYPFFYPQNSVISLSEDSKVAKQLEKTQNLAGYKCTSLHYQAPGDPIVFLHGLSYTNEIWQEIGVTEALKEKHIPFLALDMPYGIKSHCQPKTRDVEKNLAVINEAVKSVLNGEVPILVGASIGGNMALHYAAKYPVKGLFLVSPARSLETNLAATYSKFKLPAIIVWGCNDTLIPSEDMSTLSAKLSHSKLVVYEDAGHSAYRDQPERFTHDLLELYVNTE